MVSSNLKVIDITKLAETAVTLFTRYLSFAAYEIPRFLGKNTSERLEFFSTYPLAAPFVFVLVLAGFVQVFLLAVQLFKPSDGFARQAKSWWVVSYLVLLAMFCFSIKGPSSHTFYLFFPLTVVYAFSVWSRFVLSNYARRFVLLAWRFIRDAWLIFNTATVPCIWTKPGSKRPFRKRIFNYWASDASLQNTDVPSPDENGRRGTNDCETGG